MESLFPKVGQMTRVTMNNDIIPRLPPRFLGYRHTQGELYVQGLWLSDVGTPWYVRLAVDALQWLVGSASERRCVGAEDGQCVSKWGLLVNLLPHLLVWDVMFGPWC